MKNILLLFLLLCGNIGLSAQKLDLPIRPNKPKIKAVKALTGGTLLPPEEPARTLLNRDSLLRVALFNYHNTPNADNLIWVGRRLAYAWRFDEAIAVFSKGIKIYPKDARFYRHRGHRYLTIRKIDLAIADFTKAAELIEGKPLDIEPDGLPNKLNQPLSSTAFNVYYHWALGYYLKGDFARAAEIYERCMTVSINPDLLVATADWLYMTHRRLGQYDKAAALLSKIPARLEIIENDAYWKRIQVYKGLVEPDQLLNLEKAEGSLDLDLVTQGYGIGNWYLYEGQKAKSREIFEKICKTRYWSAFGYLAAEAELAKMKP